MYAKAMRRIGLSIIFGVLMFGMTIYADTLGKINDEEVMLKKEPKVEAADIIKMEKDEVVRIGNTIDEYVEILHDNQMIGYIETKYITLNEPEIEVKPTNELEAEEVEKKLEKGEEVVKFALQYVGNPYRYGGTSLTKGTDCSGFSSSVYKNFGINIQRSSRSQYASNGKAVKKEDLKPGDLVFYGYNGSVSHVAIYMGDNKIVHASTTKTGICISPLQQRGGMPYIGAKRIIL